MLQENSEETSHNVTIEIIREAGETTTEVDEIYLKMDHHVEMTGEVENEMTDVVAIEMTDVVVIEMTDVVAEAGVRDVVHQIEVDEVNDQIEEE